MSKLNDLITKLCPDGVPYKPMWAITTWDKKFNGVDKKKQPAINKHHYYLAKELEPLIVPNGDIKVLTTSPSDLYTTTELAKDNIKDGEIIAIPGGGNAIVQYYNGKYITSDNRIAIVNDTKQLNCKFLYYVLKNREKELAKYYRGAGIKHPNMFKVLHMEIPLPPLPVQEEVVRILDSFTTLEAELEAELADRKKQYEYYRDYLLDKNTLERMDGKPVEMKKLGDICIRQRGTRITAKQMKEIACVNGDILIFGGGKTKVYAKKSDIPSKDIITCPSVVVKSRGNIGFEYCDVPFTHKSELWSYSSNDEAVNIKFISYYLENNRRFFQDAANIGKLPQISTGVTDNYNVPVPSLATQERVVDILDRFDALTTSLTDGIPAEIAMRREQYEYCRSRLLDFPRLPDNTASVSDGE